MSKKNNVVIAYYPDANKATAAADNLRAWDKDDRHVKLGGIAILTWDKDKGKLKTHKVGTREAGKGAGWGTALGATLGVLTGGVTLVGGSLLGAAAGGATGSLFHKGLGLTDADKANLEAKLKQGGAALVTMTSDGDFPAVRSELGTLGGDISAYTVSADNAQKLEEAKDVPPPDTSDDASAGTASQA